jgi:ribulose-5-phosphate 4-epimerase/fuculose-1-phosphate aldolase
MSSTSAHRELAELLTTGCHILAEQSILDGFGHLSARLPERADHFMIPRGISPALVTPDDFIVLDLDGNVVSGGGQPNSEWPIHASAYAARPDVQSVLHSHARLSRIFSLSRRKLRGLLTGSAKEWKDGVPVYRYAGLITTRERGDVVAATLGSGSAALLRGHGDVVVGPSVSATVLKAITLGQNADAFHELLSHGDEPEAWSDEELQAWVMPRRGSSEGAAGQPNRAWDYYVARVTGALPFR